MPRRRPTRTKPSEPAIITQANPTKEQRVDLLIRDLLVCGMYIIDGQGNRVDPDDFYVTAIPQKGEG